MDATTTPGGAIAARIGEIGSHLKRLMGFESGFAEPQRRAPARADPQEQRYAAGSSHRLPNDTCPRSAAHHAHRVLGTRRPAEHGSSAAPAWSTSAMRGPTAANGPTSSSASAIASALVSSSTPNSGAVHDDLGRPGRSRVHWPSRCGGCLSTWTENRCGTAQFVETQPRCQWSGRVYLTTSPPRTRFRTHPSAAFAVTRRALWSYSESNPRTGTPSREQRGQGVHHGAALLRLVVVPTTKAPSASSRSRGQHGPRDRLDVVGAAKVHPLGQSHPVGPARPRFQGTEGHRDENPDSRAIGPSVFFLCGGLPDLGPLGALTVTRQDPWTGPPGYARSSRPSLSQQSRETSADSDWVGAERSHCVFTGTLMCPLGHRTSRVHSAEQRTRRVAGFEGRQ